MQFEDTAIGPRAVQRDDAGADGDADRGSADNRREPAPRVAAGKRDKPPRIARIEVPARAEATPFVGLLPPLERVEPLTIEGYKEGPDIIYGQHGQPVKKRDLRDRSGRKKQPYKKRGRPLGRTDNAFVATPAQKALVIVMIGMSVPQRIIATMIGEKGINEITLVKHFKHELAIGRESLVANIKGLLVQSAQAGSVRAQTYLLDRIGGPEFAPRMRIGGDENNATPILVNSDARVQIFLPDNKRIANS